MPNNTPLSSEQLYTECDISGFTFESTDEIDDQHKIIGQKRAIDAIHFGTRIDSPGYNLFVLGPQGAGKHHVARHLMDAEAQSRPAPADWCYVHNFKQPHKPEALRLPAGSGISLVDDMVQLVEDLGTAIPAVFESDEYREEIEKYAQEFNDRRDKAMVELTEHAKSKQVQLIHTASGFVFAPVDNYDDVIRPERFEKLPDKEKKRIEANVNELQEELQRIIRQFPTWQKEVQEKTKALDRQKARLAVGHLLSSLKERYSEIAEVVSYLDAVEQDIIDHVKDFRGEPQGGALVFGNLHAAQEQALQRYKINLIVDNSERTCAPVIEQSSPSHTNLLGRTEYQAQMGALVTNFSLIKPGDLHRANGGYLILDARQLLMHPYAWDSLKRALRSRKIKIEPLERSLGLMSTISLEPEPIPLDIKIALLGDRQLYYLLSRYDPEFSELFKVAADFDDSIERQSSSCDDVARMIARLSADGGTRPLSRAGVGRLIEHAARLAGDANKLSVHMQSIGDLLQEADYWANVDSEARIEANHIQRAIDAKVERSDRLRSQIYDSMTHEVIQIDTQGAATGQINGLSVIDLGNFAFGQPSRITATTRLGSGKIVDIERETELGGSLHSKGVLILSNFLASRYAIEKPLSLSASVVFEQSYGIVDGDSASLAELCALLSTLANAPISQGFAVTGSVNQLGRVQAIGGVNEKIEGFFDVCKRRTLTGEQGVIIPASNIRHLMLRADVVSACKEGEFRVFGVQDVDEAMEILTGLTAGKPNSDGVFPSDSINARVNQRLEALADIRAQFGREGQNADGPNNGAAHA